ncbi:MAG: hypothetical protein JOY82_08800 [Streptosporangiaceae bacterium]|nr:hypothetical protein [Streptosporangiaceae bacterium]MBV9854612.1 hypothetical protein [Streptosporangiaceae bacterium]
MSVQGPLGPAAGPAVERYLAEVTARLPGPARAHSGIVAELRSGLLDATDARRSAGLSAAQAARAAVGEFGDPALVAEGFRAEIAAGQARRAAAALTVTGPLVGLLWIAAAATSHLRVGLAPPWQQAGLPPVVRVGIYPVAVAAVLTACAALVVVATTGRLTRWLPARPRRGPTAAAVAGFGAVCAEGLGLALLAAQLVVAPGKLSLLPAAAAAAAATVRLVFARRAARRCLAIRAALT